jgi:threonine/homoserine/homoserine lactone efflux protein
MPLYLLAQGMIIGLVVAVPFGPLGLLCINRALVMGRWCGLLSGFGVATADALAAGIAALGVSLVSAFLMDHQIGLRFIGGVFLCCLGLKIYNTVPTQQPPPSDFNGLFGAYASTFLLTFSNPVTILSFIAIYAGWGIESLSGHYFAAAILTLGVFIGSATWWIALFVGLTAFRDKFSMRILRWIHKISGIAIAGFGVVVLLSLMPTKSTLGSRFNADNLGRRRDGRQD